MGYIADWLNEKSQAKQANLIVDDTFAYLRQRGNILDPYFPMKTHSSRDFLAYVTNQIVTFASVVAYGGEIPRTQQSELRKITSQLVKIAISCAYDEETQLRMEEVKEFADAKGVLIQDIKLPDQYGNMMLREGAGGDLANYIFGSIRSLTYGVIDLINFMTWDVVCTGAVNYTDPRTNLRTEIDWKNPNRDFNHFPDALIQTGDTFDKSLNQWTDYEYANGIQTLFNALDVYIDTNGSVPEKVVMSRKAYSHLLEQKSTKEAARQRVSGQNLSAVAPEVLNDILNVRGIPPVEVFDERGQQEDADGNYTKVRFMPENKFAFLTPEMGERALGRTIESKRDLNDTPKNGIYTRTYEESKSPVLDVSQAIATALPICVNDKLLYAQQIYTA